MIGALRRIYLFARAYLCLARANALLRRHSLLEVYRLLVRPWKAAPRTLAAGDPLVHEIEWAVARAAAWQWRRTVCVPRSLAAYELLRGCGARPELVVGVTSKPFSSHAWVELDGEPIGDGSMDGRHYHYRPILRLPRDPAPARSTARC